MTGIEAGLLTTNDSAIADRVRSMRDYGVPISGELGARTAVVGKTYPGHRSRWVDWIGIMPPNLQLWAGGADSVRALREQPVRHSW